jgi:flavin reductase (DIM6/NTAB) family NADH-FMN oxidoreductase RutF
MELKPDDMAWADRYKLLIGSVLPRPIAFVSTISPDGRPNIAPFSFFTAVGSNPMTMLFCPANHPDGSEKDTLRNAKPVSEGGTGEFVVNVVRHAYAKQMSDAAANLPYGESEFERVGLTPAPSRVVRSPRLLESPISFECRTLQVIRTNPGQTAAGNIVIGTVVHVHAEDGVINERFHVDAAALDLVGRMGGDLYCTTRDRFSMPRI